MNTPAKDGYHWVRLRDDGVSERHIVEVIQLYDGPWVFQHPWRDELLLVTHKCVIEWGPKIPTWTGSEESEGELCD